MTVASSRLTTFASAGWLSATVALAKARLARRRRRAHLGRAAAALGGREGVGQHQDDGRLGAPSAGRDGGDHAALERGLLGLEHAVGDARRADRAEGRHVQAADQRRGQVAAVRRGRARAAPSASASRDGGDRGRGVRDGRSVLVAEHDDPRGALRAERRGAGGGAGAVGQADGRAAGLRRQLGGAGGELERASAPAAPPANSARKRMSVLIGLIRSAFARRASRRSSSPPRRRARSRCARSAASPRAGGRRSPGSGPRPHSSSAERPRSASDQVSSGLRLAAMMPFRLA